MPDCKRFAPCLTAAERMWHTQDSQGQILYLSLRPFNFVKCFPLFLEAESFQHPIPSPKVCLTTHPVAQRASALPGWKRGAALCSAVNGVRSALPGFKRGAALQNAAKQDRAKAKAKAALNEDAKMRAVPLPKKREYLLNL